MDINGKKGTEIISNELLFKIILKTPTLMLHVCDLRVCRRSSHSRKLTKSCRAGSIFENSRTSLQHSTEQY